jgi:hypothetical protein
VIPCMPGRPCMHGISCIGNTCTGSSTSIHRKHVCVWIDLYSRYTVHQPKLAGKMAKGPRIWLALPTFTASAYWLNS